MLVLMEDFGDIKSRYGEDSIVYKKFEKLVNILRDRLKNEEEVER